MYEEYNTKHRRWWLIAPAVTVILATTSFYCVYGWGFSYFRECGRSFSVSAQTHTAQYAAICLLSLIVFGLLDLFLEIRFGTMQHRLLPWFRANYRPQGCKPIQTKTFGDAFAFICAELVTAAVIVLVAISVAGFGTGLLADWLEDTDVKVFVAGLGSMIMCYTVAFDLLLAATHCVVGVINGLVESRRCKGRWTENLVVTDSVCRYLATKS